MAKQNITVKIIGKPYPLAIDGEKEELYRLAEREINAYVTRIEQAHFKGFSKEDCLAMAAFQIAVAKPGAGAEPRGRRRGGEDARRAGRRVGELSRCVALTGAGSVNEEASDVEVRCVGRKKRERRALRRGQ